MQFGGALMTENGAGASAKQRSPEFGLPRRGAGEAGVYAPLHSLPSATAVMVLNADGGCARVGGLRDTQDAALLAQEQAAFIGKFSWHGYSVTDAAEAEKVRSDACG